MELTLLRSINALRLSSTSDVSATGDVVKIDVPAVIDIASEGRLLGVELSFAGLSLDPASAMQLWLRRVTAPSPILIDGDTAYIELSSFPEDGSHVTRSVAIDAVVQVLDGFVVAVDVPRRGHGYEISYPSGNR